MTAVLIAAARFHRGVSLHDKLDLYGPGPGELQCRLEAAPFDQLLVGFDEHKVDAAWRQLDRGSCSDLDSIGKWTHAGYAVIHGHLMDFDPISYRSRTAGQSVGL